MSERRWVLRDKHGRYAGSNLGECYESVGAAAKFFNLDGAVASAQIRAHDVGKGGGALSLWRAVPVERDTRRGIRVRAGGDLSRHWVLRDTHRQPTVYYETKAHETSDLARAAVFTAKDLLDAHLHGFTYEPIPVEVTERPTEWQIVEEGA